MNPMLRESTDLQDAQQPAKMERIFGNLANRISQVAGHATAFAAGAVIIIWAISGALFGFSDTWQLVINTGTTIVTFLMVFLIQNSQKRTPSH